MVRGPGERAGDGARGRGARGGAGMSDDVPTRPNPSDAPAQAAAPYEPVILAFTCNWCSYRAADLAGTARIKYPPNVRLVRLMCSGRLDPTFVLKAFASGADGVVMTGCWPADCHYRIQNVKALRRFELLRRVLDATGHRARALPARLRQRGRGPAARRRVRSHRRGGPAARPARLGTAPEVAPAPRPRRPRARQHPAPRPSDRVELAAVGS